MSVYYVHAHFCIYVCIYKVSSVSTSVFVCVCAVLHVALFQFFFFFFTSLLVARASDAVLIFFLRELCAAALSIWLLRRGNGRVGQGSSEGGWAATSLSAVIMCKFHMQFIELSNRTD